MQNHTKRPQVILVSMLNYGGFLLYLLGGRVAASNSSQGVLIVIATVVSFLWISAFTVQGLRHARDPSYPAVAITAFAWPSYLVAFFAIAYVASLFGFRLS